MFTTLNNIDFISNWKITQNTSRRPKHLATNISDLIFFYTDQLKKNTDKIAGYFYFL